MRHGGTVLIISFSLAIFIMFLRLSERVAMQYRYWITIEFGPASGLGISSFNVVALDGRAAVFLRWRPLDRDVVLVAVGHFRFAGRVRLVCDTHSSGVPQPPRVKSVNPQLTTQHTRSGQHTRRCTAWKPTEKTNAIPPSSRLCSQLGLFVSWQHHSKRYAYFLK